MIRVMTECKMTQSALAMALALTSQSSAELRGVPRSGAVPAGRGTPLTPAGLDNNKKWLQSPPDTDASPESSQRYRLRDVRKLSDWLSPSTKHAKVPHPELCERVTLFVFVCKRTRTTPGCHVPDQSLPTLLIFHCDLPVFFLHPPY